MSSNESQCPKCGENLFKYNQKWDETYDSLDRTYPADDLVKAELKRRDIPRDICSGCGYENMNY